MFGFMNEQLFCFVKVCFVDGNYSNWSVFSFCIKSCGVGKKIRMRKCDNFFFVGEGRNCFYFGLVIESQLCNIEVCLVSGGYIYWFVFSLCIKFCVGGMYFWICNCINFRFEVGGLDCICIGFLREVVFCNIKFCFLDGGYGEWFDFLLCF